MVNSVGVNCSKLISITSFLRENACSGGGYAVFSDNARYVVLEEFAPIAKLNERVELYRGSGLTAGNLKGLGDFKAIDVYITADISVTSQTYVCIRCSRDGKTDPLRGLSGSGFGNGDMRIVGVNIHNRSGDNVNELGTTAYRIKGGNVYAMDDRPIRVVVGVERF